MKRGSYLNEDDLVYSIYFGNGIYQLTGQTISDPLESDEQGQQYGPILKNTITGEEFYVKKLEPHEEKNFFWENKTGGEPTGTQMGRNMMEYYRRRILHPPARTHILWPQDMAVLTDEQAQESSMFASQSYTDTPSGMREGTRSLLFSYAQYPGIISLYQWLEQMEEDQINWKNENIRKAAVSILQAIEDVNRSGYVYEDIHLSRIFLTGQGDAYLNYSNLVYSYGDLYGAHAKELCSISEEWYPPEFAEPALYLKSGHTLDFESQNYSICALLFYLFFGRYAYQGRLVSDRIFSMRLGIDVQTYYSNFRVYHKMPVFIFDPNDAENALGVFDEDQRVIGLWKELPDALKRFFVLTLRKDNAERKIETHNPTAGMWLDVMEQLGWTRKRG